LPVIRLPALRAACIWMGAAALDGNSNTPSFGGGVINDELPIRGHGGLRGGDFRDVAAVSQGYPGGTQAAIAPRYL
jgi:hypothetical protein